MREGGCLDGEVEADFHLVRGIFHVAGERQQSTRDERLVQRDNLCVFITKMRVENCERRFERRKYEIL